MMPTANHHHPSIYHFNLHPNKNLKHGEMMVDGQSIINIFASCNANNNNNNYYYYYSFNSLLSIKFTIESIIIK